MQGASESRMIAADPASSALIISETDLRAAAAARAKDQVDRLAGPVFGVRPQVRVSVQRLHRRLVAEPPLHHLDALGVLNQQRGVVVAQVVERHAAAEPGCGRRGSPELDALRLRLREPDAVARRGDDQPVPDRGAEYAGEERIDDSDG
jgi:hypothetical protein